MALEIENEGEEELEAEGSQGTEVEAHGGKGDEPHSEPPQLSRKEAIEAELNQAGEGALEESILDELAAKDGELTVEDLRKLPGADAYTDEQLIAEYKKAEAAAKGGQGQAAGEATGQQAPAAFKSPVPLYDDKGQKIEDISKLTLEDLLSGKVQLGYNALGKEQRKALSDVIRNASLGHFNEQRYTTTVQERNQVASELTKLQQQVSQFSQERQTWDAALTALAMGNAEPMKRLANAYQQALTAQPRATPGMVPVEQVTAQREQEAIGYKALQSYVMPAAMAIAQKYAGAKPEEVLAQIEYFIGREPAQFFTKEKLDQILQYEVPAVFEAHGYTAQALQGGGQPAGQKQPSEIESLKQTVAALQSQIAGTKNAATQTAREKTKKAPPSGGGSIPGAGDAMPSFKNRQQMKLWMQGDPEWAKG